MEEGDARHPRGVWAAGAALLAAASVAGILLLRVTTGGAQLNRNEADAIAHLLELSARGPAFAARQPAQRLGYRFILQTTGRTWACQAVPQEKFVTGVRAFCIDDTNVLRFHPQGALSPLEAGRCSTSLAVIQR